MKEVCCSSDPAHLELQNLFLLALLKQRYQAEMVRPAIPLDRFERSSQRIQYRGHFFMKDEIATESPQDSRALSEKEEDSSLEMSTPPYSPTRGALREVFDSLVFKGESRTLKIQRDPGNDPRYGTFFWSRW